MTPEQQAVLIYRVDSLEIKVNQDHEPRLRKVENVAIKVGLAASIGGIVGGAACAAIVQMLVGG